MAAKKKPKPKGKKQAPKRKRAPKSGPSPVTGTAVVLYIDPLKRKAEEEAEAKKKRGRPTRYNERDAELILANLRNGLTLRETCRVNEDFPAESTVRLWVSDPHHPFSAQYHRAREIGAWSMFDEIVEISDDGRNDWVERRDAEGNVVGYALNGEHVQRSKLRIEVRKWVLGKMIPQAFADKSAGTRDNIADVEPSAIDGTMDATQRQMELARKVGFMLGAALAKAKAAKATGGK